MQARRLLEIIAFMMGSDTSHMSRFESALLTLDLTCEALLALKVLPTSPPLSTDVDLPSCFIPSTLDETAHEISESVEYCDIASTASENDYKLHDFEILRNFINTLNNSLRPYLLLHDDGLFSAWLVRVKIQETFRKCKNFI